MARKPKIVVNTVREVVWDSWSNRDYRSVWPLWIDDIVAGVSRLDWYGDKENQIPLSTVKILKCLTNLETITTKSVMELLDYKQSQAKLYVIACSLCITAIERSKDTHYTSMRYPHVSIVSAEHGVAMGYDR